jgi:hypothetical protein
MEVPLLSRDQRRKHVDLLHKGIRCCSVDRPSPELLLKADRAAPQLPKLIEVNLRVQFAKRLRRRLQSGASAPLLLIRSAPSGEAARDQSSGFYAVHNCSPECIASIPVCCVKVALDDSLDRIGGGLLLVLRTQSDLVPGIAHALLPDSDPR